MKNIMMGIVVIVSILCMGCGENPTSPDLSSKRIVVGVGHPYFQEYTYEEVETYNWNKWKREFDCSEGNNRFVDVKFIELSKAEVFYEWKKYEWTHIDLCN